MCGMRVGECVEACVGVRVEVCLGVQAIQKGQEKSKRRADETKKKTVHKLI